MPSVPQWELRSISELAVIGSGSVPSVEKNGLIPVMGANGQIGRTSVANFGPGYLVGRVGAAGAVTFVQGRCWASDNTLTVSSRGGVSNMRFLGHLLEFLRPERLATRNAQPLVTQSNLGQLSGLVPTSLREQHQIAEILDTVDAAIRRTEEVLAKLELLKKGLLHDLLTRGIDENGELRDPERHPEQFKESELGRIPRGWSIRTLESVGFWLSGGTPSKAQPSFWGGAIPWVSPKDMKSFFLLKTQETVTEVGLTAGSRLAPRGTVLIVVRGMILAHTFPVSLTLTDMAFNQDVKGIVPHDDVSGKFLAYWLRANDGKMLRLVTEATHGTKRLDLGDVQRQMVAIPHLPEQRRIVEILEDQEGRLLRERQVSDKLHLLKKALMDDLLTGKVRVTPLLEKDEGVTASEAAE